MTPEAHNAELAREFLKWQRDRNRTAGSVHDYSHRIARFLEYLGSVPLSTCSVEQMETWVGRNRSGAARGGPGQPSSRAKDVAVLRSFFNYLHARHHIEHNAATLLIAPTVHNTNPRPIPEDVWASVWASTSLPDEARVVLGLGFFAGLRRSEVVNLSPAHFGVPARRLIGFIRKGGGDDITPYGEMVDVFADCLPHLIPGGAESFLGPLHDNVTARLGKPRLLSWGEQRSQGSYNKARHQLGPNDIDPDWLGRKVKRWLKSEGLSEALFTPHMLRHSTCTYLLKAGVPLHLVSRLLNHSSVTVTMRYAKAGGDELGDWRRAKQAAGALQPTEFNRFG